MNQLKILFLLFLVSVLVTGCGTKETSTTKEKTTIDCGTDQSCFYEKFKTCTPSKVLGGSLEVKSGTPESCVVFVDNGIQEGKRQTMECIVKNTNSFKTAIENQIWPNDLFEDGYFGDSSCEGPLYDTLSEIYQTADDILSSE